MKKLFILLAIIITCSSCRKKSHDFVSRWQCAIEGSYNGKLVDVDTSMCNMNQAQINEFMAPHNTNGQVISCVRVLAE